MNDFCWFNLKNDGLPVPNESEFYGEQYSKPVIVANANTGQVFDAVVVYNFKDEGWCFNGLPDGPNASDYEVCAVTHWGYLPII